MASGIIIHITVGTEKRTEFFTEERVSIGSDDTNDLQIHTNGLNGGGVWLELESSDGVYRVIEFDPELDLQVNGHRIRRFVAVSDGDRIDIPNTEISFTFFSLAARFGPDHDEPRNARRAIYRRSRARGPHLAKTRRRKGVPA